MEWKTMQFFSLYHNCTSLTSSVIINYNYNDNINNNNNIAHSHSLLFSKK